MSYDNYLTTERRETSSFPIMQRSGIVLFRPMAQLSIGLLRGIGMRVLFLREVWRALKEPRTYLPRVIPQMRAIGVDSVPLAIMVAAFIGAVISLQVRYQLFPGIQLSIVGLSVRQMVVLEVGPLLTGLVLANAFSLAAWALFHRLVARRSGESAANWALVFLIAFPGALFFQFNYTESLFLLLVLLLWWGLEEQHHAWAWVAASLLPLARGVGVFAVLPIGWYLLMKRPFGWMSRWRWVQVERGIHSASDPGAIGDIPTERRNEFRAPFDCGLAAVHEYALLLAPLLGWGLYLALMWHWTGNPFEGFQAQKHWGVHSISNLWNVPKFVMGFFTPTDWHAFRGSVLDRGVFMLLLYCLPVLWRLDKGLLVWFIALGVFLGRREWRWPRYALLTVFVTLHGVLVWRFVNFRWAG